MISTLLQRIAADALFYRRILYGRDSGLLPLISSILRSRGFWLLMFQRIAYFTTNQRNTRSLLWWTMRILEGIGVALSATACRSEFMADCDIQGPLFLSNKGYYMFGALAVGSNCVIHHHVTFGMTVANGNTQRPTVGTNVWIGPHCVIAGDLHIGDGATVLPGTFLTFSVPPRSVVKGNPAKIWRRDYDNRTLRSSAKPVDDLPADTL